MKAILKSTRWRLDPQRRTALRALPTGLIVLACLAAAQAAEARVPVDVAGLSLRQQVGQLIMVGFSGQSAPASIRSRLRRGQFGGVILFGANIASRRQLRALDRSLQKAGGGGVLISTDQEGGGVRSLRFAGPRPSQPAQGSARRVGRLARSGGRQLRAAGVNVNLAPVADVPSVPGAALRPRAFRGSARTVSAKVRASVRGWLRARVAPTAKHFPGLGAARRNTDLAPITIFRSRRSLAARDLVPFRGAISAGVPLVMASHARYTALDRHSIASQSRPILTTLLRRQLGFRGVVITDALEAAAVRAGVATAAERSVRAGADIVLFTDGTKWKAVFRRLLAQARRSPAFRARVKQSATRVLELKRSLGLHPPG